MLNALNMMLTTVEEDILHMELTDTAYTKAYAVLRKKRRIIKRMIKKAQRFERRLVNA